MRFILRIAVLAFFIYMIGRAFGFRWGQEGKLEFSRPETLSGLGANLLQAIQSIGAGIINFLQPVTASYGTESTIALVGVLLIALGYMFFIRR